MSTLVKVLYSSPNGDSWSLFRDGAGKLLVSHHPNRASGGQPSFTAVDEFIARGGHGPEHHALMEALSSLDIDRGGDGSADKPELPADVIKRLCGALGQAVGQHWSSLPQDLQQDLFESAVASEGESIRHSLAIFLHGKHSRTTNAVRSQAAPEPDSLGG
jgi:hypothetical protein